MDTLAKSIPFSRPEHFSPICTLSSPTLTLFVRSGEICGERRFDKTISIDRLKERLELVSGVSATDMNLRVLNRDNVPICAMSGGSQMLGSYPIEDFFTLEVINTDPYKVKNEFSDVSRVEKFEITDAEYSKRNDSVRSFLQRNQLGKYAKNDLELEEAQANPPVDVSHIHVNDRCRVGADLSDDSYARLGFVKFVGTTQFKHGTWIGVEYDEPIGKHDGSVNGVSYFVCQPGHGVFVKPENVEVGDFPEEDFEL